MPPPFQRAPQRVSESPAFVLDFTAHHVTTNRKTRGEATGRPAQQGPSPLHSDPTRQAQARNQPPAQYPVLVPVRRLGSRTPSPPPPAIPANAAGLRALAAAPGSVQVWRTAAPALAGPPRQPRPPCPVVINDGP